MTNPLLCVFLQLSLPAVFACTTTLDPTVIANDSSADGGALATCSLLANAPSEYVICPEPLDFEAAAGDCARRLSTLAAVGSAEENDFIATSAAGIVSGNLWLGGTRDIDYVWRWPDGAVAAPVDRSAERAIADYIAGMTDRFAAREFERLMGCRPFD